MTKLEINDYLSDVSEGVLHSIAAINIAWEGVEEVPDASEYASLLALGLKELRRCVDKIHVLQDKHLTEPKNT